MHIIGAGGHSKVIIDILQSTGIKIAAIWDDFNDGIICGYHISGKISSFPSDTSEPIIIALGSNSQRQVIASDIPNAKYISVVHKTAYVSSLAEIGIGTAVMANATINPGTIVGKHCIINTNSSIDHDCFLNDFVHISPNVALAGNVEVGEGTHIGIGATVIQNIKIGSWATIGAGAVVIKNIPDFAVAVGNPAHIIKYNEEF